MEPRIREAIVRRHFSVAGCAASGLASIPRLQIVTVGELLDGKRIDMPPIRQTSVTYELAPKAISKAAEQGRIFGTED